MEQQKNIEVELRALTSDTEKLKEAILTKGATFIGDSYLHDIYFCRKDFTEIQQVEMHEVGSYSLRLRKSKDIKGIETITVNSKTITNEGDHSAWEEHEFTITDFKEAAKLLLNTEFKPFFELEKTRYAYKLENINILVEDIVDFGSCIEVEIMCTPGEEKETKEKIRQFLSSINITEKDIVAKSVTNIVMKERAFKKEVLI